MDINESENQTPKFKAGDRVTFTNDYGVSFPSKTIISVEYWEGHIEPRYYYDPSDTPWFASRESHFRIANQTQRTTHQ